MASENISKHLSENVDHIVSILHSTGIVVRRVIAGDSLPYRIEFLHEETFFNLHVSEEMVEIITYLGGVSANDSRLVTFKEASNLTNFRLICDHIIWDGPDREGDIWFLLKRVVTIERIDADRLSSAINFALVIKATWRGISQNLLEPDLSDLDLRLN